MDQMWTFLLTPESKQNLEIASDAWKFILPLNYENDTILGNAI